MSVVVRRSKAFVSAVVIAGSAAVPLVDQIVRAAPAIAAGDPITGLAFRDDDGDGVRDPLEPVVPSFLVVAYDSAGSSASTNTGSDGTYSLDVSALTGTEFRVEAAAPIAAITGAPWGPDSNPWTVFAGSGDVVNFAGMHARFATHETANSCSVMLVSQYFSDKVREYDQDSNWSNNGIWANLDNAAAGNYRPYGMAWGPDGKLYVTAANTNSVLRFDGETGSYLDTFISAGSGGLSDPRGLVWAPNGYWYVMSRGSSQILKYSAAGGFVSAVTVSGAALNKPQQGIEFTSDGDVYVSSEDGGGSTGKVIRYDAATWTQEASWSFASVPTDLTLLPDGRIAVGAGEGTANDGLYVIDPVANTNTNIALFSWAAGVSVSTDHASLYVLDANDAQLREYRISDWALLLTKNLGGANQPRDILHWRQNVNGCRDLPLSMGDRVWSDLNANGAQDFGEPGIEGVQAHLIDSGSDGNYPSGAGNDVSIGEAISDADGRFEFTVLPTGAGTTFASVAVGAQHSCAVSGNARMYCWGQNSTRALGDGTTTDRAIPTQIGVATNWDLVAAGSGFTCATSTTDQLWCWGTNGDGQLGLGNHTDQSVPTRVGSGADWARVSAGDAGVCAIKNAGTLWCWGRNASGQIGDSSTTERTSPTQIGSATDWAVVARGGSHTCAVKTTGTLWCWGLNASGQVGDGSTTQRTAPEQIGSGTTWANIDLGADHSCATRTNGALWCWGLNTSGQLGDGTTTQRTAPIQVGVVTTWNSVSAAANQTCATRNDKTAWCFGDNTFGQLGDATYTARMTPTQAGTRNDYEAIGAGDAHSCATITAGYIYCWGDGTAGKLGNGSAMAQPTPTEADTGGFPGDLTANYIIAFDRVSDLASGGALYGRSATTRNAGGVAANLDSDLRTSTEPYVRAFNLPTTSPDSDSGFTTNPLVVSVGNRIWQDKNNDGIVGSGEGGIRAVLIQVLNTSGTVLATQTTRADGKYLFENLAAGDYIVRIPAANFSGGGALSGYVSSSGTNGSVSGTFEPAASPNSDVDNRDDGSLSAGNVQSSPVTLGVGAEPTNDGDGANGNLAVDFGFYRPASVGDFVWRDDDHDGIQDGSEPGLESVTVGVYLSGTLVASATTNSSGGYSLGYLTAGTYEVRTTIPTGYLASPQGATANALDSDGDSTGSTSVTLTVGQAETKIDQGLVGLTVGNAVWNDTDNDGTIDVGETGVAGVAVQLVSGSTIVQTGTTGIDGTYRFDGVAAGVYTVRIPATEFTSGALIGLRSSTGRANMRSGPYEPGVNGDTNINSDDNGTLVAENVDASVTLSFGTGFAGAEPTDDGDADAFTNLSIDFGFFAPYSVCLA